MCISKGASGDSSAHQRTALSHQQRGAKLAQQPPSAQLASRRHLTQFPIGPLRLGSCLVPGSPFRAWALHMKDGRTGFLLSHNPLLGLGLSPALQYPSSNSTPPPPHGNKRHHMLPSTYETLSYDTLSTSNFFLGVSAPLYVDKINFHPDPQWVRLFLPLPKPVALKACFRPVA